jgi:putative hydrolase of the HAD superfamily
LSKIKHFSFDLWFTLIKSDPRFKKERANYFFEQLNTQNKTIEEVEIIFREVDKMCNEINELTGKNMDTFEMYSLVIYKLNDGFEVFIDQKIDLEIIYEDLEKILFTYPPSLFDENTKFVLSQIHAQNFTIGLLSNTAFIKGRSLRKILDQLEISQFIDFQLYSDEELTSKPNPSFFQKMMNKAALLFPSETLKPEHIMHVGDNPIADISGAKLIGMQTFQINTNEFRIADLLNLPFLNN